MPVLTPIHKINVHTGSRITIPNLSWQEFEDILEELGDKRQVRLAYSQNHLEIMAPSPEHERAKIVIADLVKIILRVQGRPWEALGSTTFKKRTMQAVIEPDECFYIENYQAVIGKDRIDLERDPPPDLAIESDVTSLTEISAYQRLGVRELWVYGKSQLKIYVLQGQEYQLSSVSPNFPDIKITEAIPHVLQRAKVVGSSIALQEFESLRVC
ncbi:MAG: Uma2 family endonuclease [Symploca sp. SIO2E6]|nr:Uma2 family endonuclease [Symploca sp. SIO2E6]